MIGPSRVHSHALRDLGEIDVGIGHRGADHRAIDAAARAVRHALHLHQLLVIGAIIVHHREKRNVVMRRSPQHARRVHQVAIVLNIHREAAVFLVGQRRAHCRRRAVADAASRLRRRCTGSACRSPTAAAASSSRIVHRRTSDQSSFLDLRSTVPCESRAVLIGLASQP